MPINVVQGAAIPNAVPNISNRQFSDAVDTIQALNLADVWRYGVSEIVKLPNNLTRIDSQTNHPPQVANLQVQLNDVQGASTLACVTVAESVGTTGGVEAAAQQRYAIRQIMGALRRSLSTQTVFDLTGTPT